MFFVNFQSLNISVKFSSLHVKMKHGKLFSITLSTFFVFLFRNRIRKVSLNLLLDKVQECHEHVLMFSLNIHLWVQD